MKGERTRAGILGRAVDLASLDGLEGVTIGRLAEDLSMSKSGLFAHFGSKEELQIATVLAARDRFVEEVVRPALAAPRGYPRLMAICRSWLDYVRRQVFPGGCFFAAASFEFDGRPGLVRDAIAAAMDDWMSTLEKAVRMAKEEGHLDPAIDPAQIAFEINALFFGANFAWNLRHDRQAFTRAQRAIEQRLVSIRVDPGRSEGPGGAAAARKDAPRTARPPRSLTRARKAARSSPPARRARR